ncbi:MAG: hypothetical protein IT324_22080 [Anaerolineae bacterium]|nr:hypothetical protein [Anaerolineae bacterium]
MLPRWLRHSLLVVLGGLFLFALSGVPSSVGAVQPTVTPGFEQMCQSVLARAVKLTEQGCSATGRNEACYGYTVVHSQLQPGVDEATHRFAVGGDILPVRMLASLQTEPLNAVTGTWGMAVLKMQANLPDTNPGQNVTFILFGDSTLQPDNSRTNAFYLSTKLGGLTCKQIPQDSLLVRAPSSTRVSFTINGVDITASSIVVLRAAPGNVLLARVLEGHVDVTASGVTKSLVAGQELTVPLGGANGITAVGAPSDPVPAPPDTTLNSPAVLLNTFDPTADKYQGPITLEGPIEAINRLMPALTVYGRLVLVDSVGGWKGLQVGDWVHIEGDVQGIMIVARSLRPDTSSLFVQARPTAVPTAIPPAPTAPSSTAVQVSSSSDGGTNNTDSNSSGANPVAPTATSTIPVNSTPPVTESATHTATASTTSSATSVASDPATSPATASATDPATDPATSTATDTPTEKPTSTATERTKEPTKEATKRD